MGLDLLERSFLVFFVVHDAVDLTPRMCRTTFATLFEGDISDNQAILGHHSAAFTLQTYRKPVTARQTEAIEALDHQFKVVPDKEGCLRRKGA